MPGKRLADVEVRKKYKQDWDLQQQFEEDEDPKSPLAVFEIVTQTPSIVGALLMGACIFWIGFFLGWVAG